MPVNLEELAIKSIEQYASLNVRLTSMEHTLADINRKNEIKDDKLVARLDKLSDDFSISIKDNVQTLKEELRKELASAKADFDFDLKDLRTDLDELETKFKTHRNTHCIDCRNDTKIEAITVDVGSLKGDVATIKTTELSLKEVRKLVTTSWGITFLRFITSKIGQLFIAAICVDLIIDAIMHYEIIKIFWKLVTFQ